MSVRGQRSSFILMEEAPTIRLINMQGKPLTDIYKEESDQWRKQFYYEQLSFLPNIPRSQGIRTEKYKYLYYLDAPFGYEELYDLENDPDETNNLATNSVNKEVLEDLRNRVKKNYETSMFKILSAKGND